MKFRALKEFARYSRRKGWVTMHGVYLGRNHDQAWRMMPSVITVTEAEYSASPRGNYTTAKDWFPTVEIDQERRHVEVQRYSTNGYQERATIDIDWTDIKVSSDGQAMYYRGEVTCKNWRHYKCSGSQKFCLAIFVGDSGHIYVHRAPASKGWMTAEPEGIHARLRKLGIGADESVIQQGDFLLKPANGKGHPDEEFRHERMGSGHHKFEVPVLYHLGQYLITEPTKLIHEATDGVQHPTITVPPGKWVVGTTAPSLAHSNAGD